MIEAAPTNELAEGGPEVDFEIDRLLSAKGYRNFVRMAWHVVQPGEWVPNWHTDAIAEHLEAVTRGEIRNLLINCPPGVSKSVLVAVFWPVWEWTMDPALRGVFASYDQQLSTRDAVASRTLVASPWFQRRWPSVQIKPDQDEKTHYATTAGGYRIATSIGGRGTGEHPHRWVTDDPHNVKRAESEQERENVITWNQLTVGSRGAAADINMRRVLVMQRLHERDLSGYLLATEPDEWVRIVLPMRYEPKRMVTTPLGWNDPRTQDGELLDPKRYPEASVRKLEATLGTYGVAGQLQQRPEPREGAEIRRDAWRYYDHRVTPACETLIQSWDTSIMDTAGSAKTACLVMGRRAADVFLVDGLNEQMAFAGMLTAVQNLNIRWPKALKKLIEATASGPAIVSLMARRIPGLQLRKVPKAAKVARLRAVSPLNDAGNVYVPGIKVGDVWEPAFPWVAELIEQCALGENSQYKDLMDCYSQGLAELEPAVWRYEQEHEAAVKLNEQIAHPKSALEEFREKVNRMRESVLSPPAKRPGAPYRRARR